MYSFHSPNVEPRLFSFAGAFACTSCRLSQHHVLPPASFHFTHTGTYTKLPYLFHCSWYVLSRAPSIHSPAVSNGLLRASSNSSTVTFTYKPSSTGNAPAAACEPAPVGPLVTGTSRLLNNTSFGVPACSSSGMTPMQPNTILLSLLSPYIPTAVYITATPSHSVPPFCGTTLKYLTRSSVKSAFFPVRLVHSVKPASVSSPHTPLSVV